MQWNSLNLRRAERDLNQALEKNEDVVVQLLSEPAFLCGYGNTGVLETVPANAIESVLRLAAYRENQPLTERLLVLHGATICDASLVVRGQTLVESAEFVPGYIHDIVSRHNGFAGIVRESATAEGVEIDTPVFVPLHPWCRVYGHFLLECLPRLAVIKYLHEAGWRFPIYIHASTPEFVRQFVSLSLPNAEVLHGQANTYYRPKKIIIPSFDPNLGRLNSLRLRFICGLVARCGAQAASAREPTRRLFVYRSEQLRQLRRGFRYLDNQDELVEIAEREGFERISPETLSVRDQVRIFSEATAIAGEYSSALHNALFSPAGTTVMSFNILNMYQVTIAMARRHRLIVFQPASGGFVTARSSGERNFSILADGFRDVLGSTASAPFIK
jgi:O-antigen biosynthesis protein WbqL